jgi:hypothetical protein
MRDRLLVSKARSSATQRVAASAKVSPAISPSGSAAPGPGVAFADLPIHAPAGPADRASAPRANRSGLPDRLKNGVEALSGVSLDGVKVHYNSPHPARLEAFAYARGREIHLGPGQERHLPHEAWHLVQQAQGRVRPTMQMKGGIAVSEQADLEHEADEMGVKAEGAAAVPPAMPRLTAPARTSPVQRAKKKKKALKPNKGKAHKSVYSQAKDPSLAQYLHKSERFVGLQAMTHQQIGATALAGHVRVAAFRRPHQRAGSGLDEGLPTVLRNAPWVRKSDAARGYMSGGRTNTDKTVLKPPGLPATGHTGTFPKPAGAGSTNTTGQSAAHQIRWPQPTGVTENEKFADLGLGHLQSLASGSEIMASSAITGGTPNFVGASAIGAPGTADPERVRFADVQHETREHIKRRTGEVLGSLGIARAPSPERERLQADGSGGGYLKPGAPHRAVSPVPTVSGTGHDRYAELAGWQTAPGRHGAEVENLDKICASCNAQNALSDAECRACAGRF